MFPTLEATLEKNMHSYKPMSCPILKYHQLSMKGSCLSKAVLNIQNYLHTTQWYPEKLNGPSNYWIHRKIYSAPVLCLPVPLETPRTKKMTFTK